MKFTLTIKPMINPKTRHRIQDVLEADGYSVIGGGQMVDGSMSDISFEREDPRDTDHNKSFKTDTGDRCVCDKCGQPHSPKLITGGTGIPRTA